MSIWLQPDSKSQLKTPTTSAERFPQMPVQPLLYAVFSYINIAVNIPVIKIRLCPVLHFISLPVQIMYRNTSYLPSAWQICQLLTQRRKKHCTGLLDFSSILGNIFALACPSRYVWKLSISKLTWISTMQGNRREPVCGSCVATVPGRSWLPLQFLCLHDH